MEFESRSSQIIHRKKKAKMALDLLNLLVIVSTVSLSVALPTAVRVVRQGVDGTGDNAHGPPCELHSSILGNSTDADTVFHEMDGKK